MDKKNTSASLEQLSLQLMNSVWLSSVIVLATCALNCILAVLALIVLRTKSVTLNSNVFVLMRFCFVNDFLLSVYELVYQSWHLANFLRSAPEVMPVERCFYVTCCQIFFLTVEQLAEAALALDRLFCVASPIGYSQTTKNQYRAIISGCCILALVYFLGSFLDTWPADSKNTTMTLILYCSLRSSLGSVYAYLFYFNAIVFGSVAMIAYLVVIATIKCRVDRLAASYRQSQNQDRVQSQGQSQVQGQITATTTYMKRREKRMAQLTKVTALGAVVSFIVGPLEFSLSLIFKVWFSDLVLRIGQYIAVLVFCNSTVNFVSFVIFMPEFRKGVINVLKMIERWIKSRVSQQPQHNIVQVVVQSVQVTGSRK